MTSISLSQFKRLSSELKCEPEALQAVSKVEAPRGPFYPDGFPSILFERHVFYKHAPRDKRDQWFKDHPTLCNPSPTPKGGYGKVDAQPAKFQAASKLDADAAMMACSWGAFQELGANYDDYGYENVSDFVADMKTLDGQLSIFVKSIKKRGLQDELRNHDWAGFARNYNGAGYRKFGYNDAIATAYDSFIAKNIDWDSVDQVSPTGTPIVSISAATSQSDPALSEQVTKPLDTATDPAAVAADTPAPVVQNADQIINTGDQSATANQQDVNQTVQVQTSQYQGIGLFGVLKKDFAAIGGGNVSFQALNEYATEASGWPSWVIALISKIALIAIIAGAGWLGFRLVHYIVWRIGEWKRQHLQTMVNTDTSRKNVEWA